MINKLFMKILAIRLGKCIKVITYRNDFGDNRKLIIYQQKKGKYPISIWDTESGNFCGCVRKTDKQLLGFLKHYNIKDVNL